MNRIVNTAILPALAAIFLAACADMFQDKIPMSGETDSLDNLFRSNEKITKLETPTQFYAAPFYSSSEVRLTWNEVRGAAYYMVERAIAQEPQLNPPDWEPEDGDYIVLERFVYGTTYTDVVLKYPAINSPEFNYIYYYRVTAFNKAMKYDESDPTEPVSAMLFYAPRNLKASGGTSKTHIELEWIRTPGAESYEIWRSDYSNGYSANYMGTALGNQNWYTDTITQSEQGKDFYYMIVGINNFGNKTLYTSPAYGYTLMEGAPERPVVSLDTNSGRGNSTEEIKIKWEAASEPGAYYAVYRYSSVDPALTRLTAKTTSVTYTDTKELETGIYYYYQVQAIVDMEDGKSPKSQMSDPLTTESFILSPPATVIAERDASNIVIKWLPAIGNTYEQNSYTYNLYGSGSMEGSFTLIQSGISPTVSEGFISQTASASNTFFKVATVHGGVTSKQSMMVAPSPAAANLVSVSRHEFISVNENANSNGVYPVKITWKKPESENPAFYHIQRSTRRESGYTKINDLALPANGPYSNVFSYDPATEIFTYIDRSDTTRVGKRYYYRVLSLNQLEQGNLPSGEGEGWGALTHTQYLLEYNKTMNAGLKKLTYMHKPGSTEKLGTETKNGAISGTIYYNAGLQGLGARIIIQLTNYAEYYSDNDSQNGVYFILNGNSNTTANMSSNGNMDGTVTCTGMYPGSVSYDRIEIKGGNAGGGTYGVHPDGFSKVEISYTVLN
jgi:hypothetical protein